MPGKKGRSAPDAGATHGHTTGVLIFSAGMNGGPFAGLNSTTCPSSKADAIKLEDAFNSKLRVFEILRREFWLVKEGLCPVKCEPSCERFEIHPTAGWCCSVFEPGGSCAGAFGRGGVARRGGAGGHYA